MALLLNGLFSLIMEGSMLSTGSPITNVRTTVACADRCLANKSCLAFFYNKKSRLCQLHKYQHVTNEELKPYMGMRFYILKKESRVRERPSCPVDKGYTLSKDPHLCYKIVLEKMNQGDAMTTCQKDGGFLIRIDSRNKQNYVNELRKGQSGLNKLWIDGSDNEEDGWRFSDGMLMTYTHWIMSSSSNEGNCIYINGRYSMWFKSKCNDKHKYICEIPTA